MNTPAHVIASCVALPHKPGLRATSALLLGAVLPDLPMVVFYGYQKIAGRAEQEIWAKATGLYFDSDWQLLFNWFNSLPLALVVMLVCWRMHWQWGLLCAASAALHMLCDLPLHNDDAHAHFLPFTHWKFISPVSYWDFKHWGWIAAPVELTLTMAGSLYLLLPRRPASLRVVGAVTLAVYAAFIGMALFYWAGTGGRASMDGGSHPTHEGQPSAAAGTDSRSGTSSSVTP